jgi:phospholipase/carboxylesterase
VKGNTCPAPCLLLLHGGGANEAGFAVLGGRILPEVLALAAAAAQLRKLRAFVSHGRADQALGVRFAHQSRAVLERLGVPLSYREYAAGHALDRDLASDFRQWLSSRLDEAATADC